MKLNANCYWLSICNNIGMHPTTHSTTQETTLTITVNNWTRSRVVSIRVFCSPENNCSFTISKTIHVQTNELITHIHTVKKDIFVDVFRHITVILFDCLLKSTEEIMIAVTIVFDLIRLLLFRFNCYFHQCHTLHYIRIERAIVRTP